MKAAKWAAVVVGIVMVLFGTVFALQGADILTDSPVMSGHPAYIYVGGVLAVLGVAVIAVGFPRKNPGEVA